MNFDFETKMQHENKTKNKITNNMENINICNKCKTQPGNGNWIINM